MLIERVSVSQIMQHPANPRVTLSPKDRTFIQLQKSYKQFGAVLPLVVNRRNNYVLSGNQRLAVSIAEGMTEVDVVFVDLDPIPERALMIALNKISGEWNAPKLAEMLDEFISTPDFDLESVGFTLPEAATFLDDLYKCDEEAHTFNNTVPSEVITQKGDVVVLSDAGHRLFCGDCTHLTDVKRLMGDDKLQLLFTDPPYNVAYDNKSRPLREDTKKQWDKIEGDDLPQEEYEKFLKQAFANMLEFFDKGATGYVWNGIKQFYFMHQALTELDCHVSTVVTWAKDCYAPGFSDYHWQSEHCLYFWKNSNGAHKWYGSRKQSNLWFASRDDAHGLNHPTQKPVSLGIKALKNSSKKGDIVVDLFAGSGSTLIASEKLGRKFYGMEISPAYCDAIVYRYAALVGKDKLSREVRQRYFKEA